MEIKPQVTTKTGDNQKVDKALEDAHSPKHEEKTTAGFYIPEAEHLIKSGYYKKAFKLMERHMSEAENIPIHLKIRLSRRIMASLNKICLGYLMKGEITRVDKFVKLMEKSNSYLFLWHELLKTYVTKTNPKYAHLQGLLDDLAASSDEELEAMNLSKSRKSSQYIHGSFLSANDTGDQKASMFAQKLKKKEQNSPRKDDEFINDTFNFLGGPSVKAEECTGTEINVSFFLDEFLKSLLCVILNWSIFFKKVMKKFHSAYRFLSLCNRISHDVETSLNPDLLNVVARVRLTLGVFYSEFGKYKEALGTFESTINVLQVEISLRINRSKDRTTSITFMKKFRKTIRLLMLVFINMSIIYEQQDDYSRTLESLRLGCFFASKYIVPEEDIFKIVISMYDTAMRKYDKYLKELGEIERIALGANTDLTRNETRKEAIPNDHFTKINEHLYNKFNYDHLNGMQCIVIANSPDQLKSSSKGFAKKSGRGDFLSPDENNENIEKSSDRSANKLSPGKDFYNEASITRSTFNEAESQPGMSHSHKYNNSSFKQSGLKDRRKIKAQKALNVSVEEKKPYKLMSEKYAVNVAPEKEIDKLSLSGDEEEKYIASLNKNIKKSHKELFKRGKQPTPQIANPEEQIDFLDIDDYFRRVMERNIKDNEQQLKLAPTDFRRIVKNYAYFKKNEEFDKKELAFANKMVHARAKEDLSEPTITTKYRPPSFRIAQENEVKLEAYYQEVRMEAEARVAQRNAMLKNAKHKHAKSMKLSKRYGSKEKDDDKGNLKPKKEKSVRFNDILLKHTKTLGINAIGAEMTELRNKRQKEIELENQMKRFGLSREVVPSSTQNNENPRPFFQRKTSTPDLGERSPIPTDMKKLNQKAKDVIQLLMEGVEKNIEEGDLIKQRIQGNRPIVERAKPKDKFLKISSDLANSTHLLADKRDVGRKVWSFSELVKGTQRMIGSRQSLKDKRKYEEGDS